MDKTFHNPYNPVAGEPREATVTVQTQISRSDYNLIKCTRPSQGTNTGVLGTLWKALADELRKRNITDVSQQGEFESLVANARIVPEDELAELLSDSANWQQHLATGGSGGRGLLDQSASGTLSKTSSSHDHPGVEGSRAEHSANEAELSNVQGKHGGKRKGSGK